jgi:hypothetical protein
MAVDLSTAASAGGFYLLSNKSGRRKSGKSILSVSLSGSRDGISFDDPVLLSPSNLNLNSLTGAVLSDGTVVLSFFDFMRNIDSFRGQGFLDRPRAWALTSADGGRTLSAPLFITEQCATRSGFPSLVVDSSSSVSRDRLYLVCVGREQGINVHHSTSEGELWSDPVRADQASGAAEFRRTPSIAVNTHGVVGVTW